MNAKNHRALMSGLAITGLLSLALIASAASNPLTALEVGSSHHAPPSGAGTFLEPGLLTGTVTDANGDPIPDVGVGAGAYDDVLGCGGTTQGVGTDADGRFTLELPPGSHLVFVNSHWHPGGHVPEAYPNVNSWSRISSAIPVVVAAGQTTGGIGFSLPSGYTISGRLVDHEGQPVPEAGGGIQDPDQDIQFGCALGFGTSPAGFFQVNVPTGTYDLFFGKDDEGYMVRYHLLVTEDIDLGDVLFAPDPEPPPVFDPRVLEPGYQLEAVVPGGANDPTDIAVTPDGALYLAAVRSWNVYQVAADGTLSSTSPIGVYSLDAGPDGNLYGYFPPGAPAPIYRISPQGEVKTVGHLPFNPCGGPLAVAPNLDLWIGYDYCGGTAFGDATLYRMTQSGQVFTVTAGLPWGILGLDFDSHGQLFMTLTDKVYRVNTADGSRTLLATLPTSSSYHGLVADSSGNLFVSGYNGTEPDQIFKVTSTGDVSVFATFPDGCLQGIDLLLGGDLVATMPCTGALYRVHPDGTWDTLLPGNGMATPQALAFSVTGELLVVNDESGRIVRIEDGRGEFFAEVVSFVSPISFMAFEPSGDFYFSEAAPGFTPRLVRVSPWGQVTEVTGDVDWPSGLAFAPDGTLYVAEHVSGEISKVSAEGQVTVFAAGFTRPQSLEADDAGNLYVAGYDALLGEDVYWGSNRIWKIDSDGERTPFADLGVADMAFGPAGELYVTGQLGRQTGVLRVASDGRATPFVAGFMSAAGLTFDLAGDLYISDDWHNSITRVTGFPQGTIQGTVRNALTGHPIPGAKFSLVTGYPVVLGAELTVGAGGNYIQSVAPRTYTVTASAPGFRQSTKMVTLAAEETIIVDFALAPWAAQLYLPLIVVDRWGFVRDSRP
jgi:sugar lactone lactonase YvrE